MDPKDIQNIQKALNDIIGDVNVARTAVTAARRSHRDAYDRLEMAFKKIYALNRAISGDVTFEKGEKK